MRRNRLMWCVILSAILFGAPRTDAQSDLKVHDLTGVEFTEEQLVDILQPTAEPPEELRPRGVGVAQKRPRCSLYRQQMTRGVGVKPATDAVAIQILFEFNSAELLPEAARKLDVVGRALSSNKLSSSCFRIEGHTDNVGSESYNERLSRLRAASVVRYLTSKFDLPEEQLLAIGYGESKPMADNGTDSGRGRNRRVQIANLGYAE